MEKIELVFRHFLDLTEEESEALRALTNPPETGRSVFRSWLVNYGNQNSIYAVLVYASARIVGWAAIAAREVHNDTGMMGVFIHESYRRGGLARRALHVLLDRVASRVDGMVFICYQEGKESLFRPILEQHGFKDAWQRRDFA